MSQGQSRNRMSTVRKDSKIPQARTITEFREFVVASQLALCNQCVNIASVFTDPSITRRKLEKGGQQIEPIEFHNSVDLWQRSRDKKCPLCTLLPHDLPAPILNEALSISTMRSVLEEEFRLSIIFRRHGPTHRTLLSHGFAILYFHGSHGQQMASNS
jgi:hypothetical protein